MTAKEFYDKNRGKYFMYGDQKVRVVGYDTQHVIISTKNGGFELGAIHNIDRLLLNDGEKCLYINIENLNPIEPQEIDLCEILKGCEGMVFYSTMVGYCRLIGVTEFITIGYGDEDFVVLESDGKFSKDGECTVFPSKENRDWSTFKKPVKVRDDDWVACCESIEGGFVVCRYGKLITDWKYIIPYDEFRPDLTEEDLKKLSIV